MKVNPEKLLKAYNDSLYKRGQKANLKQGNSFFEATIKGVNEKGQLIISQGTERTIDFGEIEWVI